MVSPVKKNIVKAVDACEETLAHLDNKKLNEAKEVITTFNRELREGWANLRLLRTNVRGKDRETVQQMIIEFGGIFS